MTPRAYPLLHVGSQLGRRRHTARVSPQELLAYVGTRMSMQHIYQPVVLRELPASGGTATLRQLARAYVQEDEELLTLVEERLKRIPLRVLKDNGVLTRHEHDLWRLDVDTLSHADRETLRLACESRLRDFVVQRAFWEGSTPKMASGTPGAVLKAADYACAACRSNTKPLQVDHVGAPVQARRQFTAEPAGAVHRLQPVEVRQALDRLPPGRSSTPPTTTSEGRAGLVGQPPSGARNGPQMTGTSPQLLRDLQNQLRLFTENGTGRSVRGGASQLAERV